MSILRIILLLLSGATVQTLLPQPVFAGGLEFPLLTGLLIYITLRVEHGRMIFSALLTGVLYDSFSPAPFGSSLPFFLLVGAGTFAVRDEVFSDQLITYTVLGLIAVAIKVVYFTAAFAVTGLRPLAANLLMTRLLFGLLMGALIIPAVYLILSALPKPRRRYS